MILYHGTGTKYLDAILRDGLLPRRKTGRRSHYQGKVRSKRDFVYLTSAYPVYFAAGIAWTARSKEDLLVLRVEVPEEELYPDEDFISYHLWRAHGKSCAREDFHPAIDPADYKQHWKESLELNGIACTPSVPPERIVDHRIIDRDNVDLVVVIGGDAMPSPENFHCLGLHYQRCVEALFDGGEEAAREVARQRWKRSA